MDRFDRIIASEDTNEITLEEDEIKHLIDEESRTNKRGRLIIAALSISIVLMVGLYIFRAPGTQKTINLNSLPLVEADNAPIKIKPTNPGGMQVADLDKTVYNNISSRLEKEADHNVNILPTSEEPIDRHNVILSDNDDLANVNEKTTDNTQVTAQDAPPLNKHEAESHVPTPEQESFMLSEFDASNPPVAVENNIEQPEPIISKTEPTPSDNNIEKEKDTEKNPDHEKEQPKPKKPVKLPTQPLPANRAHKEINQLAEFGFAEQSVKPKSIAVGNKISGVQFASFKTEADAIKEWNRLARKFPDLLLKYPPSIEKKNSAKGLYYQVQITVKNELDAKRICSRLMSQKQQCIIFRHRK